MNILSCVICLSDDCRKYYNLCGDCNNFITCVDCYKKRTLHSLRECSMCRGSLVKINQETFYENMIHTLYFIRYVIVYIFFICIPSHLLLLDYPEDMESPYFATEFSLFTITTTTNSVIIIPFIISKYNKRCFVFVSYCILNILFVILFFFDKEMPKLEFYTIHNFIYNYLFVRIHLLFIVTNDLSEVIIDLTNKFINKQHLKIKIYDIFNRHNVFISSTSI